MYLSTSNVQRVAQVQQRYSIVPHVPLILLILTVPLVLVPVPHTPSAPHSRGTGTSMIVH